MEHVERVERVFPHSPIRARARARMGHIPRNAFYAFHPFYRGSGACVMYELSRREKRRLKSGTVKIAQLAVSRGIVLEGTDGGMAKVEDPEAQKLLRHAIIRSLRGGAEPVVMRLSEAQAARFPHIRSEDGLWPWLGVALSIEGRVAVIVRRRSVAGAGDLDAAEREMHDQVKAELFAVAMTRDVPGLLSVAGSA